MVVFVQAWTDTYEITQDGCHLAAHKKRAMVGGYEPVTDFSEEGFQACMKKGLDQINARSNSMYRLVESNEAAQSHV